MSNFNAYVRAVGGKLRAQAELREARQHEANMRNNLIKEAVANNGVVAGNDGQEYEVKFNISSIRPIEDKRKAKHE